MTIAIVVFVILRFNYDIPAWISLSLTVPLGVISSAIVAIYGERRQIKSREKNRDAEIDRITNERLISKIEEHENN